MRTAVRVKVVGNRLVVGFMMKILGNAEMEKFAIQAVRSVCSAKVEPPFSKCCIQACE